MKEMNMAKPEFEFQPHWRAHGKNFCVEIVNWTMPVSDEFTRRGPNRWNIYCYLYSDHPRFAAVENEHHWQDANTSLPLHGGPTFCQWHFAKGKPFAKQIGCDYGHSGDDHYSFMGQDQVNFFIREAERLFNFLEEESQAGRVLTLERN